jgi:fatty-acyl-CoA synthase
MALPRATASTTKLWPSVRGGYLSTRPLARWLRVGLTPAHGADLASLVCLWRVGRYKHMVIFGGENIYPREIEEFLYSHPQIEDVQVVGVPPRYVQFVESFPMTITGKVQKFKVRQDAVEALGLSLTADGQRS